MTVTRNSRLNDAFFGGAVRPRLNVIGYVSGNLGLGVATRALCAAAKARGNDVCILDLHSGHHGGASVEAYPSVRRVEDLPPGINLVVLPPLSVVDALRESELLNALLARDDCFNALFTFWELPTLPPRWIKALELFDAVVAPSGYVEGALDFALQDTPVLLGLTPIDIPPGLAANRQRFNIPDGVFTAVCSFDPLSDPQRKNPEAAIAAFERAFKPTEPAQLVIKLNVPKGGYTDLSLNEGLLSPLLDRLRAAPRVTVIAESLPYRDVLSLYASGDAYISLHRAEGLGLGLLESMAMSRPVVATGWSGNKVFMSPASSCWVRHRLVEARGTHVAYEKRPSGAQPFWAEPDLEDAALWLRRLYEEPGFAQRVGQAARSAFVRYQDEAAAMAFIDDLTALHEHRLADAKIATARRMARGDRLFCLRSEFRRENGKPGHRLLQAGRAHFDRMIGWRLRRAPAATTK